MHRVNERSRNLETNRKLNRYRWTGGPGSTFYIRETGREEDGEGGTEGGID